MKELNEKSSKLEPRKFELSKDILDVKHGPHIAGMLAELGLKCDIKH